MKTQRFGTLGRLTVPVLVFASYAEADAAAGKPDAMLNSGNASLYYRGTGDEVREFVCDLLEKEFKLERKTKDTGKKDKDGDPILAYAESAEEFAKRVMSAKGLTDLTSLQPKVDAWAAAVPVLDDDGKPVLENGKAKVAPLAVDIKERERKPKAPPKLAAKWRTIAEGMLGDARLGNFLKKYEKLIGTKLAIDPKAKDKAAEVEKLAWAVQAYDRADAAAQAKVREAALLTS